MRRVQYLVAGYAAVGVLLAVSGAALAAPGGGGAAAQAAAQEATEEPTFTKDVLPILQRSCQRCHRPGTGAPMSLLTYQETRPWARAIKDRVVTRQMPPWHADPNIGEYTADPSLSAAEIATIAAWVDDGAPRGNPADAPPPLDLTDLNEWTYGEPDLIVQMEEGFEIPAEGADFYPSEVVDPGLTEDRYVKWVQIIPEAYCCVHHSHVYVSVPETAEDLEEFRLGMGSNTAEIDLIEYAMGSTGQYYPEGTGRKLPAGGLFRFAPHYHPWGEETIDRQKVGIKFYPRGEAPELIVTAHRIRTGIGHDWKLNREAVEDRLLRAGYDLDLHADRMPSGALIDDNTLNGVALLSIPAEQRRPPRALLAAAAGGADPELPAAHALPRQADAARGDSPRRPPRGADRRHRLRADVADRLPVPGGAPLPEGDHPAHRLVA